MKLIILSFIALLLISSCEQQTNLDYTKQYLNHKISFAEYISNLDTSRTAIVELMVESEKSNRNLETKISKGPVEFYSVSDTLLSKFGKTSNPQILDILSSIYKATDGYFAEHFAGQVTSFVERYPDTYKQAIIDQGKDSWILNCFLFEKGIDYSESIIFKNNTKKDSLIFDWADYQTRKNYN